jgi:hypothetical protein
VALVQYTNECLDFVTALDGEIAGPPTSTRCSIWAVQLLPKANVVITSTRQDLSGSKKALGKGKEERPTKRKSVRYEYLSLRTTEKAPHSSSVLV